MIRKIEKKEIRNRIHARIRRKLRGTPERPRLAVFRSVAHIYAQVIDDNAGQTLVSASSVDKGAKTNGGNVAAAKLVRQVTPLYPPIAKTAHISGTVMLHAVIAKDGTIQELTYVSGPPLLMKNAMDAVHQWRYSPTLLNGEPVEVDTTISVVFTLGG